MEGGGGEESHLLIVLNPPPLPHTFTLPPPSSLLLNLPSFHPSSAVLHACSSSTNSKEYILTLWTMNSGGEQL